MFWIEDDALPWLSRLNETGLSRGLNQVEPLSQPLVDINPWFRHNSHRPTLAVEYIVHGIFHALPVPQVSTTASSRPAPPADWIDSALV